MKLRTVFFFFFVTFSLDRPQPRRKKPRRGKKGCSLSLPRLSFISCTCEHVSFLRYSRNVRVHPSTLSNYQVTILTVISQPPGEFGKGNWPSSEFSHPRQRCISQVEGFSGNLRYGRNENDYGRIRKGRQRVSHPWKFGLRRQKSSNEDEMRKGRKETRYLCTRQRVRVTLKWENTTHSLYIPAVYRQSGNSSYKYAFHRTGGESLLPRKM